MEEGTVNEAKLFIPVWIQNELQVNRFVSCILGCVSEEGKHHFYHEDYEANSPYVEASIFLGNSFNNVIHNGFNYFFEVRLKLMRTKVTARVVKGLPVFLNQILADLLN